MTTLHQHLRRREAQDRLWEHCERELEEELGREPTEAEVQERFDDLMESARYDCPNGGDGFDD